jgi:ribosomal protein S17
MDSTNQGEKPHMKKFLLPLALVLVAGVAVAQAADTKPASEKTPAKTASAKATMKTHVVKGEVVSADATAKTITVKVAGEDKDKTVPVHGKAAAHLASLKAGEKVALTCVDNAAGEHQYVRAIKVEKAAASTAAPSKTTAKATKKPSSK